MVDEGEILVPATQPIQNPTPPTPGPPSMSSLATSLVRDILDYMRQNFQSRLAMLTALANAANKAVTNTGRTYLQYTSVIASQILRQNQQAITNILNTIWPPVRPTNSPSPTGLINPSILIPVIQTLTTMMATPPRDAHTLQG